MKLLRKATLLGLLALNTSACALGALQGGTINTPPPTSAPVYKAIAIVIHDEFSRPIAGIACGLEGLTDQGNVSNDDGYIAWGNVPATVHEVTVVCGGGDYLPFTEKRTLALETNEDMLPATMLSQHVDPRTIPLIALADIHGAMWPLTDGACGGLSLGPRPGQADNVIGTVFITDYSPAEQDCSINEIKARGYTHVVMGPLVDSDGYHGVWSPNDWRGANFEKFLDAIQKFYDNHLAVVVFGKPDGWELIQFKAEFTSLLSQPRAQKLIRIFVPMGWEAGANYEYSSCTWAEAGRWTREVLPNALVLVHMVSDRDAPAGTDALCNDDDHNWNPGGNAAAWGRVVPFYHGWLTQSGAFDNPTGTGGDREHPELTNFQNWQRQFDPSVRGSYRDRFEHSYAGWPTGSAWGPSAPLWVYAGEYSSYWRFWQHRTEAEGVAWGDAALKAGAAGCLDSCSPKR